MIAQVAKMPPISSRRNVSGTSLSIQEDRRLELTKRLSSQVSIGLGFTGAFLAVAAILLVGCYSTSRTQNAWRSRSAAQQPPSLLPSVDSDPAHEEPLNMPLIDEHHNAPSSIGASGSAEGDDPVDAEHP